jgi:hypothetical protein
MSGTKKLVVTKQTMHIYKRNQLRRQHFKTARKTHNLDAVRHSCSAFYAPNFHAKSENKYDRN